KEAPTKFSSTAANAPLPVLLAAVVVERCNANERGYLLAIEGSQLRQISNDCSCGSLGHSRNAGNEFGLVLEVVIGVNELFDLLFELGDLLVEHLDDLEDAATNGFRGDGISAI